MGIQTPPEALPAPERAGPLMFHQSPHITPFPAGPAEEGFPAGRASPEGIHFLSRTHLPSQGITPLLPDTGVSTNPGMP